MVDQNVLAVQSADGHIPRMADGQPLYCTQYKHSGGSASQSVHCRVLRSRSYLNHCNRSYLSFPRLTYR